MPDLESHRLAERRAYLDRSLKTDAMWSLKVRVAFPRLRSNPQAESQGMKHHLSASAAGPFETFVGPVTSLGLVRSYIEG